MTKLYYHSDKLYNNFFINYVCSSFTCYLTEWTTFMKINYAHVVNGKIDLSNINVLTT